MAWSRAAKRVAAVFAATQAGRRPDHARTNCSSDREKRTVLPAIQARKHYIGDAHAVAQCDLIAAGLVPSYPCRSHGTHDGSARIPLVRRQYYMGIDRGRTARVPRSPPSKEPGLETRGPAEALLSPGNAEAHVVEPLARPVTVAASRPRWPGVPGTATSDTAISGVWAGWVVYGGVSVVFRRANPRITEMRFPACRRARRHWAENCQPAR